jgi:hypothetical protein
MDNHQEQDAVLGIVLLLIFVLCLGFSVIALMCDCRNWVSSIWGGGVLLAIFVLDASCAEL